MKILIAFLLWNSLAFGATRPIDRVRAYAGNHKVTVRLNQGVYWVEMEGSDIFGVGPTVDDAAEDFMVDVDIEAHETDKPYLKRHPGESIAPGESTSTYECPATQLCI